MLLLTQEARKVHRQSSAWFHEDYQILAEKKKNSVNSLERQISYHENIGQSRKDSYSQKTIYVFISDDKNETHQHLEIFAFVGEFLLN